ncbi:MAG: hypothetical protein U0936_25840 [Planctomycetaceae bacterium]
MNDWSFDPTLAVWPESISTTLNRLRIETAVQALTGTLPRGRKPLQVLTTDDYVRSVHGAANFTLYNSELLDMVRDRAGDFVPPQDRSEPTGLYAGEQDMFCFSSDWLGGNRR